jgi:hypothetical protein
MSADMLPDPEDDDAEAEALGKCYSLPRARARELREQKTLSAVTFAGTPADSDNQGDPPKRATYEKHSTSAPARQIRVNGRVVGEVRGGTFYKTARASVHFLRRPAGIALDLGSLADAEDAGARYVEIFDRETGRHYHAAISTIRARGFELDRGFGRQVALPLDAWARDAEPAGEQLALFA